MVILVKSFGILMVALGAIFLARPAGMKNYIAFWVKGKRIYTGAALSLIIGIIFLLAASGCKVGWFVAVFGVLAFIKGIALFVLGQKKIMSMMKWWQGRSLSFLRFHALLALAAGALLIYAA